jgi:hypothetical protein
MKYGVRVGRSHRSCNPPDMCADYLVPQMQAAGVGSAFKYISLQIGSNDLCSACEEAKTGNSQCTRHRPRLGMLTSILQRYRSFLC